MSPTAPHAATVLLALALAMTPARAEALPPESSADVTAFLDGIAPLVSVRTFQVGDAGDPCAGRAVIGVPARRGPATLCILGDGPPRCVATGRGKGALGAFEGAFERCRAEPSAPAPAWLPAFVALGETVRVEPFAEGGGLVITTWPDGVLPDRAVAVRGPTGWRGAPLTMLDEADRWDGAVRSVDATGWVGRPARAVVVGSYGGGSGRGTRFTQLYVFALGPDRLEQLAVLPIGASHWARPTANREAAPSDLAAALRARHGVVARLDWRISGDTLVLRSMHPETCRSLRARPAASLADAGLDALVSVCDFAGRWKIEGDALVRAPPAKRR